jgi:broad specificity phosphatase PhoE
MKWPSQLTLIRHAESTYNHLKERRKAEPLYAEFRVAFESNPTSPACVNLAKRLHEQLAIDYGDSETRLTDLGLQQAKSLAQKMEASGDLPDIIYVSPYLRTKETLMTMFESWPELGKVRVVEEERIREQEFGLRIIYSDWRIMMALYPDQYKLYKMQGAYWYRWPQGENIPDVRQRNRSWVTTLTRDFANQKVMAVTHHITILSIRANMERLNAAQFLQLDQKQEPKNCSLTIYTGKPDEGDDGRLILSSYNQSLSE